MRDQKSAITTSLGLNITAISADGTTAGNIIDIAGYESVTFIPFSGTLTDGTYTPLIEHGDASNLSDAAAVSDDFLVGTEANAAMVAANDNIASKRIGYVGNKRYVRLSMVASGVTSGGTVGAVCILGNPSKVPTA